MRKIIKSFILLLLFFTLNAYSQDKTSGKKQNKDTDTSFISGKESPQELLLKSLQLVQEQLINEMIDKNKEKHIQSLQAIQFSAIRNEAGRIRNYFDKGIDTVEINHRLRSIKHRNKIASEEIYIDNDNLQTTRNLKVSEILINELAKSLESNKKQVNDYLKDVNLFRHKLDSLINDTILYKFPKDTASLVDYFNQMLLISQDLNPVDSNLNKAIKNLNDIDDNINNLLSGIYNNINIIKKSRSDYEKIIFSQELPYIWEKFDKYNSFNEVVKFSYRKNRSVFLSYLNVYINNNLYIIIILSLLVYLFIRKIRKRLLNEPGSLQEFYTKIIIKQPLISSIFISLNLFQFVFPSPPVIFSGIIWLVSGILLIVLLTYSKNKHFIITWILILIFSMIIVYSDLLLKISLLERLYLLAISAVAFASGIIVIKKQKDLLNKDIKYKIFPYVPLLMFLLSFILNVTGRFNLSKTLLTAGVLMIAVAVMLYVSMRILENLILFITSNFDITENEKYRQNLIKLNLSLPKFLKTLTVLGFVILVGRNFYFYDYIISGIQYFISTEQTIGSFKFTLAGVLIFIFIIIVSTIISKIISLYSDSQISKDRIDPVTGKRSGGLGNWLLLIRIAIVSAGVLIAFAATGIPIDRLTIILGSLGVGIGFGMQTIVNNLMSGILLAFERPIQIGDQIEVEGKSGIIREIGIRSSKLETFDGSDIIIPNGDLLSKFVVNWTRNNNQRRIEILINVKSGSDTVKCKEILESIIKNNEFVEKMPEPIVLLSKLESTSVEFRTLFWADIFKATELKSEILYIIQNEFKKAGIELTT